MAGRNTLYLWVVLATAAVVFTVGPVGGNGHLQGQQGSAYDRRPELELMANTKTTARTGPKKKRDYSNHPWKKNWPDFRTTPRPSLVLEDDKYDRRYDSFAVDRSEDSSEIPDDIRLRKGGIGNRSYIWTLDPRQPPLHPYQKTWPDTRPYHFADPGPGPHRPKKNQEEKGEKENQKKRDKNKNKNNDKKKNKNKKKKSLVSAFLNPQLIHDEIQEPMHPWRNMKPTLVDLKQRVRRAATKEAPSSLFVKGPKKMLNEGLGLMQQQLNRITPTSATSQKSTVRVAFGGPVQPTTLKPNDPALRKIAVETTTQDRSIITAPLKTCPDGQRMGPNRVCVANYTDPEGSD